ncbi:MAG TPA: hypothetical protein VF490_16155 [Chryseosolibacter sp.]
MTRKLVLFGILLLSAGTAFAQTGKKPKKTVYEEVDLENVMKRYFGKSFGYSIEGIYSVSCVITRRNKKFLSKAERIRIVGRQDNYAKVAIMKDWPSSNRDFIEVSLSYKKANHFPIMGELDIMAQGAGYIYTHLEPDGKKMTFSMLESEGLLEAEYSQIEKRKTITYKLSYLKIYPTASDEVTLNEGR